MEQIHKSVGYWLLVGAFLVVTMVIVGGYTRLSHSGLSMVTWKPITGVVPPLTDAQWEAEFSKYKSSPEYQKLNNDFSVDQFKTIYWPEFIHRLLGRVIGLAFIIPFAVFLYQGKIKNKKLIYNLLVIFLLGALQGVLGWYMVKSGLVDIPSVSQYRLAAHFITALTLFVYILWTALNVLYPKAPSTSRASVNIRKWILVTIGLLVIQLIYGAFVAGLKAGLIFPTWPTMGPEWIPDSLAMSLDVYGLSAFFEFPALVQFIHRWLAAVIVILIAFIVVKGMSQTISNSQKNSLWIILAAVTIQFLLGVFTLLYLVPISLGVLHQLGAVVLLSTLIIGLYNFRKPSQLPG